MEELDDRKRVILRAVVVEYVATAEPVGSHALTDKYPLGVRSATVRNELAEMAELGLLEQPHTSAGRIPSDRGFRYYVDRLIVPTDPTRQERQALSEAAQEGEALQTMLSEATRALSRLTQLLAAATTLRGNDVAVRHAVVSAMSPSQALLVLVLSTGQIENRLLDCPPGLSLEDVGKINDLLSRQVVGLRIPALAQARTAPPAGNPAIDALVARIWSDLRGIAQEYSRGQVIVEGEEFLLAQPEFRRDFDALQHLMEFLQDKEAMYEAVSQPGEGEETIRIGKENSMERLHPLSVVRHVFMVGETMAGAIALIGPKRMHYDVGMPLVRHTAQAISESLARFGR